MSSTCIFYYYVIHIQLNFFSDYRMLGNGNAAYLTNLPVVILSRLIFIDHFAI
jgi:hypothetical protein